MVGLISGGSNTELRTLLKALSDPEAAEARLTELEKAEEGLRQEREVLDRRREEVQAAQGQLSKDTALFEQAKVEAQDLMNERSHELDRREERLRDLDTREKEVEEKEVIIKARISTLTNLETQLARALGNQGG